MRAIKSLLKLSLLVFALKAQSASALDQFWTHFQFNKKLAEKTFLMGEYLHRDEEWDGSKRMFDLYRASWGVKTEVGTWQLGAAYLDFDKGADERRLFQLWSRRWSLNDWEILPRLGLEERWFLQNPYLYLRGRVRGQLTYKWHPQFQPLIFDEAFYIFDGRTLLRSGWNENRYGFGFRSAFESMDLNLWWGRGVLYAPSKATHFEYLHLLVTFAF